MEPLLTLEKNMETKQKIRSICKGKRNSLTENQIDSFGEKICNNSIKYNYLSSYFYKYFYVDC